jgi:hypothetical protein
MTVSHRIYLAAVSAILLTSLGGCSVYRTVANYISSDKVQVCPDAAILASTASLPAFDPSAPADPSNVLYTVDLTDVETSCDVDKKERTADASVKIVYRASRAPGGEEVHYRVPFYIAVTTRGEIKEKKVHWLELDFGRGETVAAGSEDVDDIEVKPGKGEMPNEYRLVAGFQLTQAQLDYNKKIGRYYP